MITDAFLTASSANITAVTASPGSTKYDSTDCWDMLNARDMGEGHVLRLIITIPAGKFAGGSGSTVDVSLWTVDDPTFSSNEYQTSPVFVMGVRSFSQAQLAAGGTFEVPLGLVSATVGTLYKRYIFVRCSATGTNAFTGTGNVITGRIVLDSQDGKTFYPSGFTA